eukprot:4847454-Pyramimonas_sp.AAC.1
MRAPNSGGAMRVRELGPGRAKNSVSGRRAARPGLGESPSCQGAVLSQSSEDDVDDGYDEDYADADNDDDADDRSEDDDDNAY